MSHGSRGFHYSFPALQAYVGRDIRLTPQQSIYAFPGVRLGYPVYLSICWDFPPVFIMCL